MSKKATIRELDDHSLEKEIGRLRTIAYPQHPEVQDYDFYSSVYRWYEKHPLADQMRRWAAVTEDGEVVGFLSAFPQYYRINGKRVIAHTPADYMAHPDYGFYALSLMRKFFRTCENCVACDMVPATIRVETRLGAEVAGQLHYAAKLLSVSKIPMPPMPRWLARTLKLKERTVPVAQGYAEPARRNGSEDSEEPEVIAVRPQATFASTGQTRRERGARVCRRGARQRFWEWCKGRKHRGVRRFFRRVIREGRRLRTLHPGERRGVPALALRTGLPPAPGYRSGC